MRIKTLVVAAGVALTPAMAMAQWSDNFDSYALGTINGQGGWQGWDGVAGAAGNVSTDVARSGHNSQRVAGPSDSVHQYSGYTSGLWSYVAYQYIPHDFTGDTYFILNNEYNNGGPYNWSIQIKFAGASGLLNEDMRAGSTVAYVRDAWAELRFDIDFTANTVSEYYNGTLFASGTWAAAGPVALGGVDLFANGASSVYYDDMSITRVPAPASLALAGLGVLTFRRRR